MKQALGHTKLQEEFFNQEDDASREKSLHHAVNIDPITTWRINDGANDTEGYPRPRNIQSEFDPKRNSHKELQTKLGTRQNWTESGEPQA